MHAIVAFFLTPIGKYVGLALLALAVWQGLRWQYQSEGAADATAKIERANDAARDAADQGQQSVTECKGTWNREVGECEP